MPKSAFLLSLPSRSNDQLLAYRAASLRAKKRLDEVLNMIDSLSDSAEFPAVFKLAVEDLVKKETKIIKEAEKVFSGRGLDVIPDKPNLNLLTVTKYDPKARAYVKPRANSQKVAALLKTKPDVQFTIKKVASALKITPDQARNALNTAANYGDVKRIDRGVYQAVYAV